MPDKNITVKTQVGAPLHETWTYYTESEHVINWNFASEDWHCPKAINDLREGGKFKITMASNDGNMEVDLDGTYDEIRPETHIAYTLDNGRHVTVDFAEQGGQTGVTVTFEPGQKEPRDHQEKRWQGILNNFKKYVATK